METALWKRPGEGAAREGDSGDRDEAARDPVDPPPHRRSGTGESPEEKHGEIQQRPVELLRCPLCIPGPADGKACPDREQREDGHGDDRRAIEPPKWEEANRNAKPDEPPEGHGQTRPLPPTVEAVRPGEYCDRRGDDGPCAPLRNEIRRAAADAGRSYSDERSHAAPLGYPHMLLPHPARRRALIIATVVAIAGGVASSAEGKLTPKPGDSSSVAQYVEQLPTSTGLSSSNAEPAPLPVPAERALRTSGGKEQPLLKSIATSSAYGARRKSSFRGAG